jgi:hypothetical protein
MRCAENDRQKPARSSGIKENPPVVQHTFATSARKYFALSLSVLLLAALLSLVGASPAHAATTESEPNGSTSTADVVSLGATISGSSQSTVGEDTDIYAVDLPSNGKVNLDFRFLSGLGTGNTYDITIYSAAGDNLYHFDLAGGQNDGTWLASQAMYAPKGRIYVEVYGNNGWASWGSDYALTVKSTAGNVETELNGSTPTADVVRLGTRVDGSTLRSVGEDSDIYAIDLPANGSVNLNLRFPSGLGTGNTYDIDVSDSAGENLYHFDLAGDRSDGAWLASQAMYAAKGRIYVEVFGDDGWASWGQPYSLTVKSVAGSVETESNGGTSSADVIDLGAKVSGSTLRSAGEDTDIYVLDLPSSGKIGLNFTFPSGLGAGSAYDIDVYNSAGDNLYHFDLANDRSNGTWLRAQNMSVTQGRVYVSIYGDNGWATWGKSYTLLTTLSFKTAQIPTISGTATVGKALSAQLGTWAPKPASFSYQWKRNGTDIPGATRSTYTLVAADAGSKITVTANGSKPGYTTATKTSAPKTVALLSLTAAPVPKISGTAKVGKVLTVQSGTWGPSPVSVSYQWQRNGKTIAGATKSTYTVKKADAGQKITVKVTGKKTNYTTTSKTSAAKSIPAR